MLFYFPLAPVVEQGHKRMNTTVNATSSGFDFHSRKIFINLNKINKYFSLRSRYSVMLKKKRYITFWLHLNSLF